jgi:hypothetical protein
MLPPSGPNRATNPVVPLGVGRDATGVAHSPGRSLDPADPPITIFPLASIAMELIESPAVPEPLK